MNKNKTWRNLPRKSGGGRKPKHKTAMVKLNARVPDPVKAALIAEFGSVQKAVDALIIERIPDGIQDEASEVTQC